MKRIKNCNIFAVALFGASAVLATTAQANVVQLEVQNASGSTLQLVSGTPSGLPRTIAANSSQTVTLYFGGTRSDIEATYRNVTNGTTCRFTASHIEQTSGPSFSKSATPVGTPQSTCYAYQTPSYRSPYNYSARFSFYY